MSKPIATLRQLAEALTALCDEQPELADKYVCVPSECGYTSGSVIFPVLAYTEYDSPEYVTLHSDDDIDVDWIYARCKKFYIVQGKEQANEATD